MDYEAEIRALQAENIALQAVVTGLMMGLKLSGGRSAVLAEQAFSYADKALETMALTIGDAAPPGYFANVLRILEQLRAAVYEDHNAPRHGV